MTIVLEDGRSDFDRKIVKDAVRNAQFFIRDERNNKVFGKVIEFTEYMGAYGAIVVYPTGEAGFWGYDHWKKQIIYLGEAPALPRMGVEERGHELNRIHIKTIDGSGAPVLENPAAAILRVVQPVGEIDQKVEEINRYIAMQNAKTASITASSRSESSSVRTTLVSKARALWQR